MALSVYWDAWWHEAIGRESFWIPPHLGIYTGLLISLSGFVPLLTTYQGQLPRTLQLYATGIATVIISGYADELWHQAYGVERFGTLESIWSPTHVAALAGGIIASLGIITYLSTLKKNDNRLEWLVAAQVGVLVSIATLVLLPLGPETPFRILGIWGAPVIAFAILAMRFYGSALSEKPWSLTLITTYNWMGNSLLLTNHATPTLLIALVTVGLVPPVLADLIIQRGRKTKSIRNAYLLAGLQWGVIFGALFYPLTNQLTFTNSTVLDSTSLVIIGITSATASVLAAYLAGTTAQRRMLNRTLLVAKATIPTGART